MKTRITTFSILALVSLLLTTILAETKTFPVALVGPAIQPQATNPPYLSEMPTVERVMREVQGKDPMDTAAQQIGALLQLREIISDLARARGIFSYTHYTADESRLYDGYYAAYYSVWQPIEKSLSRPDRSKWYNSYDHYRVDRAFRDELLTKFFSAEFRAAYYKATSKQPSQPKNAQPTTQPGVSAGTSAEAYFAQGKKYLEMTIRRRVTLSRRQSL